MKREDVIKQLFPGIVVGIILGCIIGYLVGVDEVDVMKNNIGGLMACFIPCLLNCTIVLKGTSKVLKRDLSIGKAFVFALPEIALGALIGFAFHAGLLGMVLKLNTCLFSRVNMTLLNMALGVLVSTIMGYCVLKRYEKKVKWTKRTKKK